MPTIVFSLVLLAAAMALVFGLVGVSDAVLKMRATARNRHSREQQFVAQAAAEVRSV